MLKQLDNGLLICYNLVTDYTETSILYTVNC